MVSGIILLCHDKDDFERYYYNVKFFYFIFFFSVKIVTQKYILKMPMRQYDERKENKRKKK